MRRMLLLAAAFVLGTGTAMAAPTAKPAPPAKPAPKPGAKPASKPAPTSKPAAASKGSTPKLEKTATSTGNPAVRRQIAGGPTAEDAGMGAESPELAVLRAAERELFPPAAPPLGSPWPSNLPFPTQRPEVHASGVPSAPPSPAAVPTEGARDLSWMGKVALPELPIVWNPRIVRYVEFFTQDPRGRSSITVFARRAGRYEQRIRSVLRQKGMPEDLLWLSMVESAHDPRAKSPVGAAGLWQFMPETGKVYGLVQDRWADQRFNPVAATEAAAALLSDLKRRFGSWDLAMASYNMGYGGIVGLLRRYNTNDYWALSELEGGLPWETTLYVPKILALSVVMKNLELFGFKDLQRDAAVEGDDVTVPPQTLLSTVAQAAGVNVKEIEVLNPELRAGRTPPEAPYVVKVPRGKAEGTQAALAKKSSAPSLERYVVRAGETLPDIAARFGTTTAALNETNKLTAAEGLRPGTVLLLPKGVHGGDDAGAVATDGTTVVVPQEAFAYPDRKRVFYRIVTGDTLKDLATRFGVTMDDLRRWNVLDPEARLHDGMTLQVFVPKGHDLASVAVALAKDVRIVAVNSAEFFELWESKGRTRQVVAAKAGDTLESIGAAHGVSPGLMERINRKGRKDALQVGESVVLYLDPGANGSKSEAPAGAGAAKAKSDSASATEPLGDAIVGPLPPLPAR